MGSLFSPHGRTFTAATGESMGSTNPTRILDWDSLQFETFARKSKLPLAAVSDDNRVAILDRAYATVAREIQPVYALDDRQRVSTTISRGRGSCSQRFAVLEAFARAAGIATRVRGLILPGSFWSARFRYVRAFLPESVVIAMPEFYIGRWMTLGAALESLPNYDQYGGPFTNDSRETLFEAAARSAPLPQVAVRDIGVFDSRDDMFLQNKTFSRWAEIALDPLLSRFGPQDVQQ